MPDMPEPTSHALTKGFYVRASDIAIEILKLMKLKINNITTDLLDPEPHDVPGEWFKGPF